MDELEERIRARAYQMWENEGRPDGQAETHWEKARILVAIEDDRTSLKPVEETKPEEARIMENLGEFRGAMTDQGGRTAVSQGSQARPPDSAAMIKSKESLQGAGEHPAAPRVGVGKPWSDVDDAALSTGTTAGDSAGPDRGRPRTHHGRGFPATRRPCRCLPARGCEGR